MSVLHPTTTVFIEFKERSVHVLDGDKAEDFPLVRDGSGRITPECAAELRPTLGRLAGRKAVCAIPARGVSLRLIAVPLAAPEEIARMLPLQIEAQFPVPPSELAYGYMVSERAAAKPGMQQLLVAAVKREVLEQYRQFLAGSGIEASFTIAALARCALAGHAPRTFGVLETDQPRSELIVFEESGQAQLRSVALADLRSATFGQKLFIGGAQRSQAASELQLNGSAELLEPGPSTAANHGLKQIAQKRGGPALFLDVARADAPSRKAAQHWKWPALAAVLLLSFLALRALEPALQKPRLEKRLGELQQYRAKLPSIERELGLLQFIKTNQPPFLEAITVLSESSPRGTRFESISLGRRGELSVRGMLGNPQAGASEFRSKLIASGLFAKVVLDEQTPDQQGQKLTFRLTAQLNPEAPRKSAATNAPPAKKE